MPIQIAKQECKNVTQENCDIIEREEPDQHCIVVPANKPLPSTQVCHYQIRSIDREVCQDVKMQAFREECGPVPKEVSKVECSNSTMKKTVELKEICVDVDLQLPREECSINVKQDCR